MIRNMALRSPTYFILASLSGEPLHGYGVAKRAETLSGGEVKLAAGTLYGALDRLVAEGMVEVDREEQVQGRRRRYYRITEAGTQVVAAEATRMREAANVVTKLMSGRLGPAGNGGVAGAAS